MNILLIDDHFCAREGTALLLNQMFDGIQIWEAQSVEEGLRVARTNALNLMLLDVQLPGKSGLEGLREFRDAFPNLAVVMFSGSDDRELVFETLRLGAMGFIPKTVSRQEFKAALRDVLSGRPYLPVSVVGGGTERPDQEIRPSDDTCGVRKASRPADFGLTPREFEVLGWLVQGRCNKEIARRLSIQEQTVRNHLRPIFQKFGVARRTELMLKVFEQGIVFGTPEVGN